MVAQEKAVCLQDSGQAEPFLICVMNTDLISIIIPTCSRSHFLHASLESALKQTYDNTEILIVDDNGEGSTEQARSYEAVKKYIDGKKVKYIRHERQKGGSAARNTGIKESAGKYTAFLDDDDSWNDKKIEKQFELLKKSDSETGLIYCGVRIKNAKKNFDRIVLPVKRGYILRDLLLRNHIRSTSCILCKKKFLSQAGMFDEKLPIRQDIDLYIRMSQICKFDFINEPLVMFNQHEETRISHSVANRIDANYILFEKFKDTYKLHPKAHSQFHYTQGKLLLKLQDYSKARKHFFYAFKIQKTNFRAFGKLVSITAQFKN